MNKILFSVLLFLCSCTELETKQKTKDDASVIVFSALDAAGIFTDSALSQPLKKASSHGVVFEMDGARKVWLTDGRIGWMEFPSGVGQALQVVGGRNISVLDRLEDYPNFASSQDMRTGSGVVGMSSLPYLQSPTMVTDQGRALFKESEYFQWPMVRTIKDGGTYWVEAVDIHFTVAKKLNVESAYGLIQKPFISLFQIPESIQSGVSSRSPYLELADQKVKRLQIPKDVFELEQVAFSKDQSGKNISAVVLYSSKNNCSIFRAYWSPENALQFGFCQYGATAPTPIIESVDLNRPEYARIQLLVTTGHDTERLALFLSQKYRGEQSLVFP